MNDPPNKVELDLDELAVEFHDGQWGAAQKRINEYVADQVKQAHDLYPDKQEWVPREELDKAVIEARIDELSNHVAEWLVINNATFDAIKDRIKQLKKEGQNERY